MCQRRTGDKQHQVAARTFRRPGAERHELGILLFAPVQPDVGVNASANGSSSRSRWNAGATIISAAPLAILNRSAPSRHSVSSVVSRRIVGVVGHNRSDSNMQARR
jgi:hypothetical protein